MQFCGGVQGSAVFVYVVLKLEQFKQLSSIFF